MNKTHNIKEIKSLSQQAAREGVFPGAGLGIATREKGARRRVHLFAGTTRDSGGAEVDRQTIFDLASLTKPLATTLLLLTLIKEGVVAAEETVGRFFARVPADKKEITLCDLLGHNSGLAAHRPFFRRLTPLPRAEREKRLLEMILADPLQYPRGSQALYSDLGFLLLGLVVEKVGGRSLDILFQERITGPLGLTETLFFNADNQPQPGCYAATEFCPWRGRVLAGEVSDENCFAMGGVAGHAGLFGTTPAVLTLVEAIHDLWQGETTPLAIDPADVQRFLTRVAVPGSTRALGFDTPSATGSSAGRFFSPRSAGHLGFTGTSFWIDPEQHVMVVLLTNRVHPSRDNQGIKVFRPRLHDAVMRALGLAAQ